MKTTTTISRILGSLFIAALVPLCASVAHAQDWPNKPVRFVVSTPAGSGPDIIARIVGEKLGTLWGQQVVIDNRAGAGGIPAMVAIARAAPDGYTFGVVHAGVITLTPHLFKEPQFNFDRDFTTVSNLVTSPLMIAVTPGLGVSTLPEFIKLAKSKPGKVNFALPLLNSVPHLAGEQLSSLLGIKLYAVPYSGSSASIMATVSGDGSDMTIDAPAPLMPYVKTGKLKALAMTSSKRLPGFEDIPTVAETIPNFEAYGWFGLFAPAKVPDAVVARVNRDVATVLAMPDVVARLTPMALFPAPGSPAAAAAFVKADRDRWAGVIKDLGIKPE